MPTYEQLVEAIDRGDLKEARVIYEEIAPNLSGQRRQDVEAVIGYAPAPKTPVAEVPVEEPVKEKPAAKGKK